jgi:hypothetical protein
LIKRRHMNCQCATGSCQCDQPYSGADCSVLPSQPPYAGKLPQYGLCDVRTMSCSSVIVYGKTFVPSNNLTCHLQECEVCVSVCVYKLYRDISLLKCAVVCECETPVFVRRYLTCSDTPFYVGCLEVTIFHMEVIVVYAW